MIINIGICISFIIVLLIIASVFFSKRKIIKIENSLFKKLIIITIFGLIIESVIYYLILYIPYINFFIITLLIKLMYVYYVVWMYFFVSYGYIVYFNIKDLNSKKYKRFKSFMLFFYGLAFICSVFLPIKIQLTKTFIYPLGIGTYFQYIVVSIGMIIISFFAIVNKNKMFEKKSLPLFFCVIFGIFCSILQYNYHEFLFIIPSHAIAILLMYFTIENPDLKLIEEFNKNKKMVENSFEDRTNTLFQISEEVRIPIMEIESLSKELINSTEKNIISKLIEINKLSNNVYGIVNNILNISSMDINNIKETKKVYNSFEVETTMLGKDLIDKIKRNNYDLILIDDEMKPDNAVEIIKNINSKKNKIVVMLEQNKEIIKNHYLSDYCFIDYLLKKNYKEELNRIITKYLR